MGGWATWHYTTLTNLVLSLKAQNIWYFMRLCICISIYIFCGRRMTIIYSSNQIPGSEGNNRLSYLPVNICICIPQSIHDEIGDQNISLSHGVLFMFLKTAWITACYSYCFEEIGRLFVLSPKLQCLNSNIIIWVCLYVHML